MFANINDVDGILAGVKRLLRPEGVFVIQVFYLYDVVKSCLLENFNHEHPSYYFVKSLRSFFERNGMELFDVEHVAAKGGSIRCFIQFKGGKNAVTPRVAETIAREEALGLGTLGAYRSLIDHIETTRAEFRKLIEACRKSGKKIAAYGTSIGATIFTYQYDLGDAIEFFVDDDPARHGLLSPGHRIPVLAPEALYEKKPDYVIAMAPLYADLIIAKHKRFSEAGGRFIKFRPKFEVI